MPAHRFSSDDGAISWQQAPFPPSDEWNLGNRERPSTVREEDRLRHYLWFSFSCAGAAAVQAKLKTIANAKIIRMKHQIGLAGISFNPHHFIFKKEGRF